MSLKRSSNGKAREASVVILRLAGLAASARLALRAYFSPSWTLFQADRGRHFSVIVDGVSG